MPLLNRCECRDSSNDGHWNEWFQKHSQWNSDEKQPSCHFICNGMRKNAFFVHHKGGYLVNDFDGDNHTAPNP